MAEPKAQSREPDSSNRPLVGRLAPSPTGAQHVGNARTYLIAWLSLRSRGGRVILRIEDIDSPRVKPWATQQAIDDLRWLGLDWDEGPDMGGPSSPYIQSDRVDRYSQILTQLIEGDGDESTPISWVYPCTCTRSDIADAASAPHQGQEGPIYPGTCAGRVPADAVSLTLSYAWRFRAPDRIVAFRDRFVGEITSNPAREFGDFVIGKKDGTPAYQLAVVVDDHEMGVTEVCRGDDLLPSAIRQITLYDALGWEPPGFVHLPLVIGSDGRRLAKRHGDTRISVLRDQGVPPERLLGLLAWSCGWQEDRRPVTIADLLPRFDLSSIPREPFVMTPELWHEMLAR
jgi:glutamyl-tRNA synthetase